MRMHVIAAVFAAAVATAGCSSPEPTRAVSGQLSMSSYALDNPVVLAESSDSRVFITHVSKTGHFTLQLPMGKAYRLTLANTTSTAGTYKALGRINWPHDAGTGRWAVVGMGDALDLGNVVRRGYKSTNKGHGPVCDDGGGDGGVVVAPATAGVDGGAAGCHNDDGCHEDSGSKCDHDDEDDCDCDHGYKDGDNCEPDPDSGDHDNKCNHDHGCHTGGGGYAGHGGGDEGGGGHHGGGQCDGGAGNGGSGGSTGGGGMTGGGAGMTGGGGEGGSMPGGPGSSCTTNTDCAGNLTCMDNVCTTPTGPIT